MMTLAFSYSLVSPSIVTTEPNADGGTARWKIRRGLSPISCSALYTAVTSGLGLSGSAAAKCSRLSNSFHAWPLGLARPNWAHAALAWARNSSSVSANWAGADPMTR